MIPGNHDIQWLDPDTRSVLFLDRNEAEREYSAFANSIPKHPPVDGYLGFTVMFPRHRVALTGLNSARLEQAGRPGVGYVGFDQLRNLCEKPVGSGYIRIAFMHHHPLHELSTEWHASRGSTDPISDGPDILYGLRQYGVSIVATDMFTPQAILHHIHRSTHLCRSPTAYSR